MLRLALRGMRAHRGRLVLSACAVMLGVSFVTASFVITDSLESIFTDVVQRVNADVDLSVRTEAGPQRAPVLESALTTVRATPGVAAADGFVGGFVQVVTSDRRAVAPAAGAPLALSWSAAPALSPLRAVEGRRPTGPGEVAVDRRTARSYGIEVGDVVTVAAGANAPAPFNVVGLAAFGRDDYPGGSALFGFDLATMQGLVGSAGGFDSILVDVAPGAPVDQVRLLLLDRVGGDRIEVATRSELVREGRRNIDDGLRFLRVGLYGFALVSVVVAGFLIINTFGVVVAQRTRELGLLAALGATPRQLFVSVIAEAAVLGSLASAAGIVAGVLAASGLRSLLGVFDLDLPSGALPLRLTTILLAMGVGTGAAVVAAAVPARRAATIPPIAAIRSGFVTGGRLRTGRIVLGIAFALLAYAIATVGLLGWTGNAPATVGVAGIVGFVTLVTLGPALASVGATAARAGREITRRLAADGIRRQPVRTAATASALAVGVALVSGVSVFAASATSSLHHDLVAGLDADAAVEGSEFFELGGFVADRVRALPEVGTVLAVRRATVLTPTTREVLAGVDLDLLPAVVDIGLLRGDLRAMVDKPAVALQEDAARHIGVDVGDDLVVDFPILGSRRVPVVAVYRNGSVVGSIMTTERLFVVAAGDQGVELLLAKAAPDVDPAAMRSAIRATLADSPFVVVRDPAQYEQARAAQVDRLLALTAMLLSAAVAVAVLGVANTLALSVMERRREIGLLRAVGMTSGQVETLVTWEAVVVAVLGVVSGVVLGLGLGLAFAFSLSGSGVTRVAIPAPRLLAFVLVAGVSAVAAAVVPARRAGQADVLGAITVD